MARTIRFDLMVEGRFYCTFCYPCKPHPVFMGDELVNVDFDESEVREYVESKFPSLRGKQYSIEL